MDAKIIYTSDYHGIVLKNLLVKKGRAAGLMVEDIGICESAAVDYVDISKQLAETLGGQPEAMGVLTCNSGEGAAMALNRFTHIRACVCQTVHDAIQVREKFNANVICLDSQQTAFDVSIAIVDAFLRTPFTDGKHAPHVQKLSTSPSQHLSRGISLIVRALIIHENHILLTQATASNHEFSSDLFFLPGGHVDHNEPCLQALRRELGEEMALPVDHAEFKGILECSWDRRGQLYHELNVVYLVRMNDLDLKAPPASMEGLQTFVWEPIDQLPQLALLPVTLKPLIQEALGNKQAQIFYSEMQPYQP